MCSYEIPTIIVRLLHGNIIHEKMSFFFVWLKKKRDSSTTHMVARTFDTLEEFESTTLHFPTFNV